MRVAVTVNLSRQGPPFRDPALPRKNPIAMVQVTEHVDATTRTLAPESRHIVASVLSGTTSRAAVLILYGPCVRRKRPGALSAPGEG